MDKELNKIFGDSLNEDIQEQLQEAFAKKLTEARQKISEETELKLREEFARRYEHDKGELVEAMDRMLTDVITKHATEQVSETKKLKEVRSKYAVAVKESRSQYKQKITEHKATMKKFVMEQMSKEVKKLREQQTKLNEMRNKAVKDVAEAKKLVAEKYAGHRQKIDEFVVRQITKELKDFQIDHRALVESRIKLVAESRSKLKETQLRFIKESAKKVNTAVNETLKREMTQLHEDLERNRQNMFGRRIFEAVASEFMSSYLSEGTETKKLQKVLETKDGELTTAKKKLEEAAKLVESTQRRVKLAEEKAQRTKTMNELLSNLARDKREIMGELLETVKTQHLREAFNKYLPTLTQTPARKVAPPVKKPLTESTQPIERRTVAVTGNQRPRLDAVVMDPSEVEELNGETARILRLAGINK